MNSNNPNSAVPRLSEQNNTIMSAHSNKTSEVNLHMKLHRTGSKKSRDVHHTPMCIFNHTKLLVLLNLKHILSALTVRKMPKNISQL